jgi:hypothetical protein
VAIHRIGDAATLSGYCWHVDGEVFVRHRQLWHVYNSLLMTPFQTLSSSGGDGISIQGQDPYLHSTPVGW